MIRVNDWGNREEAEAAQAEFPYCARCGAELKIHVVNNRWWTLCTKSRWHRGMKRKGE